MAAGIQLIFVQVAKLDIVNTTAPSSVILRRTLSAEFAETPDIWLEIALIDSVGLIGVMTHLAERLAGRPLDVLAEVMQLIEKWR